MTDVPEPIHPYSLTWSCGCREEWLLYQPMDEPHRVAPEVCPQSCRACTPEALCDARRALPPVHAQTDFADITPVRRTTYRRMAPG